MNRTVYMARARLSMTINKSSAKYCQTETIISSSIQIKTVAMTLDVASVYLTLKNTLLFTVIDGIRCIPYRIAKKDF